MAAEPETTPNMPNAANRRNVVTAITAVPVALALSTGVAMSYREDRTFLETAHAHLAQIHAHREQGRPSDNAFCIFDVGDVYLQFLARPRQTDLSFEAVSEVSAPALAPLLSSKQGLLRNLGLRKSTASPNYVRNVADTSPEGLFRLSGVALEILHKVYEVHDLKGTRWTLRIPSVVPPATPIRVARRARA